jgi:hypothetical protein
MVDTGEDSVAVFYALTLDLAHPFLLFAACVAIPTGPQWTCLRSQGPLGPPGRESLDGT